MSNYLHSVSLKSNSMEELYRQSDDPWGNRENNTYAKLLAPIILTIFNSVPNPERVNWCDIGCGGGNVARAIISTLDSEHLDYKPNISGVDVSETAILQLRDVEGLYNYLSVEDLEDYSDAPKLWSDADVISLIDVMYYWGVRRPWKVTADKLWESLKPGTLVLVADGLVRHQYRDYFKFKSDCKVIKEYTERSIPSHQEIREDGSSWYRYLKVRLYQKV